VNSLLIDLLVIFCHSELSTFDPRTMPKSQNPLFRPMPQAQSGPKPKLVPLASEAAASRHASSSSSKPVTFGERIKSRAQTTKPTKSSAQALADGVISQKYLGGGGMEMSFIPKDSGSSRGGKGKGGIIDDDMEEVYDAGKEKRERERATTRAGVEEFGAGMEKGGEEGWEGGDDGEAKSGRTKRRVGGRMASGNTFRSL
jgi:ribosome biogenesis protein ENP2